MKHYRPLLFIALSIAAGACGSNASGADTSGPAPGPQAAPADAGPQGAQEDAAVLPLPCPTAPPFDDSDATLVARCTRPVFVGAGNALRRAISYDGMTWLHDDAFPDQGQDQNENSHRDVLVRNGIIIIVGDGGILVSKDGGATFVVVNAKRLHNSSVGFFKGAFWVVSNVGTFTSLDGSKWTDMPEGTMVAGGLGAGFGASSIATSPTKLLAVSASDSAYRTVDGSTWTEKSFDSQYLALGRVTHGNGRFAMIGNGCCDQSPGSGLRATSVDGASWTLRTNSTPPSTNFRFGEIIWDGSRYFATGSQYDSRVYTSPDGLTFKAIDIDVGLNSAVFFEGAYVAAGAGTMYRSSDGTTWSATLKPGPSVDFGFARVAAGRVLKR